MLPAIEKTILTEDQRLRLMSKINAVKATVQEYNFEGPSEINQPSSINHRITHNPSMGKIYLTLRPEEIGEDIAEVFLKIAQAYSPDALFNAATYTEYSVEHGRPNLINHMDRVDHFLLIDYQLNSTTSWDLIVEGNTYQLQDNDALLLYPGSTYHSRPEKMFSDGDVVSMIFFDYWKDGINRPMA